MMDDKVQKLLRRFDAANAVATLWRPKLQTAYQYIMPNRNSFNLTTQGQQLDQLVYDSTAILAAISFASKLHSTLTPPFIQWADLTAGSDIPENERQDVNKALQEINKILFKYLHASNFDLAVNECYMDISVGTAELKLDEGTDDQPFIFTAVPVSQMAFEEDKNGLLDNNFREWEVELSQIKQLWPKAKLPHSISQFQANDPRKKIKLKESTTVEYQSDNSKLYIYTVIETVTNTIIYEDKSPSSCWIPFRWSKLAGDIFGRGPGMQVLSTVKRLNQVVEYELGGAAIALNPPFVSYNNSEFNANNFRIRPNTLLQLNTLGALPPGLRPLEQLMVNPNIKIGEYLTSKMEAQINKAFFTDPLGPVESPAKTATEILQRQQELMERIGPAFGRLQAEFLVRVIERCVYILVRKGLIPAIKVDGKIIAVKYRSPLARSQSQADVLSFTQMFQTLAGVVGPEMALLGINPELLPEWLAEKFGTDLKLVKSPFDLEMMKQQLQQVAMQQLTQQQQGAA